MPAGAARKKLKFDDSLMFRAKQLEGDALVELLGNGLKHREKRNRDKRRGVPDNNGDNGRPHGGKIGEKGDGLGDKPSRQYARQPEKRKRLIVRVTAVMKNQRLRWQRNLARKINHMRLQRAGVDGGIIRAWGCGKGRVFLRCRGVER
ncbi:MAG: hypothetical protein MPJ22_00815 [Pirellulales bacterium]|nr:hypothetical protein [Pirellulales bacterium]